MDKTTLDGILADWNRDSLTSLEERFGIKCAEDLLAELGTRIYSELPTDRRCYCGLVAKSYNFPSDILSKTKSEAVAVGSVMDDHPQTSGGNHPVVIVVGINYTQFTGMKPNWRLTWKATGMRSKLAKVIDSLDANCLKGTIRTNMPDYHMVAVNFFPWITRTAWDKLTLNGIAETLVLHCWGYDDPAKRIASLIEKIAAANPGTKDCTGTVPFVIFHGADNAVPILAIETIRYYQNKIRTNAVLCDNLAAGPFPLRNAVVLHPDTPLSVSRKDIRATMDS